MAATSVHLPKQGPVHRPGRQSALPLQHHAHRQRGVYALEWAIIFPVFFALLYAIISYGLTFLVRESMQYAVEEGARAALRYPSTSVLAGATAPTWEHRKTEAWNAVQQSLFWPTAPNKNNFQFTVCRISNSVCDLSSPLNANLVCTASDPCLVLVSYSIPDYRSNAIAPGIPGLNLILPDKLQADASTLADRRML